MSVSDPLLKELKGLLWKLIQDYSASGKTTDDNEHLMPFCVTLEKIFQKGLHIQRMSSSVIFLPEPWDWLNAVGHAMDSGTVEKVFGYMRSWESVRDSPKAKTMTAKLRLLIRTCLVNKCLHIPVMVLSNSMKDGGRRWYTPDLSILGNEILCEIFISALRQCCDGTSVQFDLNLKNSRFLDKSWLLPCLAQFECVPCTVLGLSLRFADDHAIVTALQPSSVAAENDQVQVGDVLDELNGVNITAESRGRLGRILKNGKHRPISIQLVKARTKGVVFAPLLPILRKCDITTVTEPAERKTGRRQISSVQYLGACPLGSQGDVKQIEKGISTVTNSHSTTRKVRLECEELGLRVVDEHGKVILYHCFMELSACGQVTRAPKYFAYIVGNDVCNVATEFTCHVFLGGSESECRIILQNIGQGFERTHFAV